MPDDEPFRMPFSLDEVTSKIAYAYARQQVFVWIGLFCLFGGPSIAYVGGTSGSSWLAGMLTALFGAGILVLTVHQNDLKVVGRTALLMAALAIAIDLTILVLGLRGIPSGYTTPDVPGLAVMVAVLVATFVTHPMPTRRGGTVLYDPPAVRKLSNVRTLGFGSLFTVIAGLSFVGGKEPSSDGSFFAPMWTDLGLLLVGIVGLALFLREEDHDKTIGTLTWTTLAALVIALVGLANTFRALPIAGLGLAEVLGLALILVVVQFLSPRLNQGKTIVSHRA